MKAPKNVKTYTMITLLLALFSFNGFSNDGQKPTITKTFDLNQPGTLNASSSGGGVVVKTHNQEKVIIQAFVRKRGKLLSPSDPRLDEVLEAFELDFSKRGSDIYANVERRSHRSFWNNVGISLTIIVPQKMSCYVSSSGGGLKISGVEGTHDFSSSGGGVRLEHITGTVEATSSGGSVKVAGLDGNIRLKSSGGGVTVTDSRGNIYARSSGGGVHLENIYGDAEAYSSGGGVSITGEIAYVKAKSSGGSVRVNISKLTKELYLESSGGGISAVIQDGDKLGLDLDLRSGRVNIDLHNFSGRSEKDRVKGTMNNGGIPVYMHASGGNVKVAFND